jgi:CheY-like chemotaxis protein
MKVLLVEDDEDKREQLILFINEKIECDLVEVRSFQSALKAIKEDKFDLILLDMTMPTFNITPIESGGRSQPFGGKMLLYEMQRRRIVTKVIVVTQFDIFGKGEEEITLKDLNAQLSETFKGTYLGSIQYSINYTGWKDALYKKIENTGLLKK